MLEALELFEVLEHAFLDTILMLPWLFAIYVIIEIIETKFGSRIGKKIMQAGKAGPLVGATLGLVPQCGFSIISTALYNKRLVTTGTLLAVYISTSDEAIPIILAQPDKIGVLLPLLTAKLIIALLSGFSIDLLASRLGNPLVKSETCAASEEQTGSIIHGEEVGCCGHNCAVEKPKLSYMLRHPAVHTLKIYVFIFAVTVLINLIIHNVGEENLGTFLMGDSVFQPVIAGLIGIIPNCAASVAVTQMYLVGGLGFGAAVAGLSSGAGLGILVLFKENQNLKDSLKIIGLLYGISVVAGIIIQAVYN